jgi:hypothetical protein
MLLHHMIDIDYIDTNINLVGNDSERNIMIPTNQLSAASGKGRLSALWFVSGLVALSSLGARGAKPTGAAAMLDLFDKVGPWPLLPVFTGLRLAVRPHRNHCLFTKA